MRKRSYVFNRPDRHSRGLKTGNSTLTACTWTFNPNFNFANAYFRSLLGYDLGRKAFVYANHGIPELWVIDAVGTSTPVELVPLGVFARLNNPAWSPNNDGIAFDASTAQQEAAGLPNGSNQIYAVGYSQATRTLTTGAMQLTWGPNQTGDRPGNNVHPAWFHDGQSIIFSGCTPNATRTACDAAYTGADIRLISFPSKTVDVAITSTSPTVGVWYNSALDPHADYIAATLQTSCSATKIMRISLSNGAQTTLFSAASTLVDNAAWSSDSSKVYFDRLPATIGPTIWTTTVGTPPATSPAPTEVMLAGNVPIPCGSGFPNAGAH